MAERGLTFKEAVNDAILRSSATPSTVDLTWPTYDLEFRFDPTKSSEALAALDDEDAVAKLERGA